MGSLKKNILTQLIIRISTFTQLWEHFLQNRIELFRLEKPWESTGIQELSPPKRVPKCHILMLCDNDQEW